MSYAIVRVQKMKQADLKGIQIHNQREKPESTKNREIDTEKSQFNYDLVNDKKIDYVKDINQMIQDKVSTNRAIRKDAVRVAEFLVTSDNEFFDKLSPEQEKEFFEKSLDYFKEKYGEDNIAYATVHKDEKTPHMHVGFVPITEDNRLAAKHFFGQKSQLHKLQDEFHKHVKENGYDLERGVTSDRKHIEINKFKTMTQEKELKKLESKIEQIKPVNEDIEKIEQIKGKTGFNRTVLSEDDYETLKDLAGRGLKAHYELKDVKLELLSVKDEYKDFKADIGSTQQKVREHAEKTVEKAEKEVQEIKLENKHINANLNDLAEDKAKQIATSLDEVTLSMARSEGYVQGKEVAKEEYINKFKPKWDNLVQQRNELKQENEQLTSTNQKLASSNENLKYENKELTADRKSLDDELTENRTINKGLMQENKTLKHDNSLLISKVHELSDQLEIMKKYMDKFKDKIMGQVKTFLSVSLPNDLHSKIINKFKDQRERLLERAEEGTTKELQKELVPDKEIELEHE